MKIAFDAKRALYNRTGLGNYSRFVINGLADAFPQDAYSLYAPGKGQKALRSQISPSPSIRYFYPEGWINSLFPSLWRSKRMVKDLRREGIELYHGLSNELPAAMSQSGIPSVVTLHDLIFLRYPQLYKPIDRKIYTYKFRQACLQADKVIAISRQTRQDILSFFGIPEEKIEILYQGCDPVFGEPVAEAVKQAVREKYNLPSSYILYVGSIEERKNLLLLVQALKDLKEDLPVVAVGRWTPYVKTIEAYIEENRLGGRVRLLHTVSYSELPALYRMAALFVYPSFFEGFGIPILEAQKAGVPVIAATGSCLEEAGGPAALYTDPTRASELRGLIESVLNEPQLAENMRRNGWEYGRRFEPRKLAEEMRDLYRRVVS